MTETSNRRASRQRSYPVMDARYPKVRISADTKDRLEQEVATLNMRLDPQEAKWSIRSLLDSIVNEWWWKVDKK